MEIHQILPALSYEDAVSNDAIEIRNVLRNMGYVSNIYAKYVHEQISKATYPLKKYKKNPNNIVIYHFSLGDLDVTKFVKLLPDIKVLMYHNITPHYYFKGINDELAQLCRNGRYELKSLSKDIKLALGVSEYNRKELLDYGFINTDVLPIIVDFSKYDLIPNNKIIQNFDDGYVNLLFVGRIAPNKKQEDLIKTFIYYKRINPKSRLFIIGSPEGMDKYYAKLQFLIEKLDLNDVFLTGKVEYEDLLAYYTIADVFISMSEHEGFCVPLIEAMYFKVPIIAYNSTAIPDTLNHAGILINKKKYVEIAEMIELIVKNHDLQTRLIDGQTHRLKHFNKSNTEDVLRIHIERLAIK
ncbi:MAG: glycosyltransferase family 4 protein [ANME-2 cluster archaeon]|nr:glycosyltransferase family 4 protein [ANME-2 cluster archaeon]